jgi:hypothetical protein
LWKIKNKTVFFFKIIFDINFGATVTMVQQVLYVYCMIIYSVLHFVKSTSIASASEYNTNTLDSFSSSIGCIPFKNPFTFLFFPIFLRVLVKQLPEIGVVTPKSLGRQEDHLGMLLRTSMVVGPPKPSKGLGVVPLTKK